MPVYEYRCTKGHEFDVIQRMSDDALTECQVCGSPVQRVFHPPNIHFKGSGFYNTDYGTKKRSREKEAAAASESSGDGASSGDAKKSESKDSGKSSESGSGSSSGKDSKPKASSSSSSSGSKS